MSNPTVTRELRCAITERERREYGDELARLYQNYARTEQRKKEAMADFKAEMEQITTQQSRFADAINTGYEFRHVECVERYNADRDLIELIRLDTGEVADAREPRGSERQASLDLEIAPEAEPEPVDGPFAITAGLRLRRTETGLLFTVVEPFVGEYPDQFPDDGPLPEGDLWTVQRESDGEEFILAASEIFEKFTPEPEPEEATEAEASAPMPIADGEPSE